ncbi:MAG TPA: hypothetical protein VGK73_18135 [Polyangiaceae bacterium]
MRPSKLPVPYSLTSRESSRWLLAVLAAASTGCLDRPIGTVTPSTTNIYVNNLPTRAVDKIDLLFMIDNSRSMSDKQKTLADAVPKLLQRLVTPNCVGSEGEPNGSVADADGHCAAGKPEFRAIRDIHIGVISSSLGNHGGERCTPAAGDVAALLTPDDRAELLPTANPAVRGALDSWNGSGFLAWDPGQNKNDPPGESNLTQLVDDFSRQVTAAGDKGCGFESSLEAWYRFLVDPEPPVSISSDAEKHAIRGPINETVLAQRKAFLRPDSLLAVVMLSDENDCSINDDDGVQGGLITGINNVMPRASAACAQNPNDPCCHTCALPAPDGCTPNEQDTECSKKAATERYATVNAAEDHSNLRCFAHKKRYGIDLLYPVDRYIDALTKPTVKNRAGADVPNPIFATSPTAPLRPNELVLLAGIVGVPWQDVSTEESWTGEGLEYLTADELTKQGRWDVILGDDQNGPGDPFMRESVQPRTGINPLVNVGLVAPGTPGPKNPINGNEQNVPEADDLQYACTYPLPPDQRRQCVNGDDCDCHPEDAASARSLCEYPDGPTNQGVQIAAKAYPGVRQLEVLRGVGQNGIVASICPKSTQPSPGLTAAQDPSYGYNPAVAALLEIIKERIPSQCLPRPLPIESNPESPEFGHVPCAIVETVAPSGTCSCDAARGRISLEAASPNLRSAVEEQLTIRGVCGGDTGRPCRDYCLCQLEQLEGDELSACQAGADDPNAYGYCYVDPAQGIGNPELVAACGETKRRVLRFVGEGLPANGSDTFIACVGAPLRD